AAGTPEEDVRITPLFQLDWLPFDHLTSVVVPAATAFETGHGSEGSESSVDPSGDLFASGEAFASEDPIAEKFTQVVSLMETLRSPGGCPWDLKQTHESLRRYVLEEAYEVVECIDSGQMAELPDELGDL